VEFGYKSPKTDRLINCKNNGNNSSNINTKFNERNGSTNEQISKPIKPFSQMSVKFRTFFFWGFVIHFKRGPVESGMGWGGWFGFCSEEWPQILQQLCGIL